MKRLAIDAFTANVCWFMCYVITAITGFMMLAVLFIAAWFIGFVFGIANPDNMVELPWPFVLVLSFLMLQASTMLYLHFSRRQVKQ
jgi:hypothetical protein